MMRVNLGSLCAAVAVVVVAPLAAGCSFEPGGLSGAADAPPAADADPSRPDADPGAAPDASRAPDGGPGVNRALLFDGLNDYLDVNRPVQSDFTLEAWIRTTESVDASDFFFSRGVFFANVLADGNDFGGGIMNDRFGFGTGNPNVTIQSQTIVTTGEWIHVAVTRERSAGTIELYINGLFEAKSEDGNTVALNDAEDLDVGGNLTGDQYFQGYIDDVRVWNVARSEPQIQATMNVRLGDKEPGLLVYWPFDEVIAGMVIDESNHGNHGELGGGDMTAAPISVLSDAPVF